MHRDSIPDQPPIINWIVLSNEGNFFVVFKIKLRRKTEERCVKEMTITRPFLLVLDRRV